MTISIQNTITNSIKATLKQITIANGFQTNGVEVKRGVRTEEDFQGSMPGIALLHYENDRNDSFQPGSESRERFRIWGFVKCEPDFDDYDPLDKLAADCEKILMSSTYNPDYYTNTFIRNTIFYEGGSAMNFGIFDMNFEVSYFYKFTEV